MMSFKKTGKDTELPVGAVGQVETNRVIRYRIG